MLTLPLEAPWFQYLPAQELQPQQFELVVAPEEPLIEPPGGENLDLFEAPEFESEISSRQPEMLSVA